MPNFGFYWFSFDLYKKEREDLNRYLEHKKDQTKKFRKMSMILNFFVTEGGFEPTTYGL